MIDMHAHWRPAEVADALRARTKEPRLVRTQDGVEVLKSPRMGEEPLDKAVDHVDFHLARMARPGGEVSVLSLLGSFCWVESQPLAGSGPLCRLVNDTLSQICVKHAGRVVAHAALPLTDISAATAELALSLARESGDDSLALQVSARLAGYREGRAFLQPRPARRP